MTIKSYLGKFIPIEPDTEQMKQIGWNRDRILVVSLSDERLTETDRDWVRYMGNKLYVMKKVTSSG